MKREIFNILNVHWFASIAVIGKQIGCTRTLPSDLIFFPLKTSIFFRVAGAQQETPLSQARNNSQYLSLNWELSLLCWLLHNFPRQRCSLFREHCGWPCERSRNWPPGSFWDMLFYHFSDWFVVVLPRINQQKMLKSRFFHILTVKLKVNLLQNETILRELWSPISILSQF